MTRMTSDDRGFSIREETAGDRDAVRTINEAAFGGMAEANLVVALYAGGDALFGLVAESTDEVFGHILFSRLPIVLASGEVTEAASLAPLAVSPHWQRRGVGSLLVREGLECCREREVPSVVVLGDPAFYTRFGFSAKLANGLQSPWSGPHLMALELTPGSLRNGQGVAQYPAPFMTV